VVVISVDICFFVVLWVSVLPNALTRVSGVVCYSFNMFFIQKTNIKKNYFFIFKKLFLILLYQNILKI
jgi:hypothetical protein